ncbi:MAG: phasin family protein [Casimicrobiaceae bacterium]
MAARKSPAGSIGASSRTSHKKRAPTSKPKGARPVKPRARAGAKSGGKAAPEQAARTLDFASLAKGAKLMSPAQAMELYKANARMALDMINAAIDSAARVRALQVETSEKVRAFGQRQAQSASRATSPEALVAAGQGAAREAIEHAMGYWSQMFDLIVEIQKRLFTLIEGQMSDVPGVKEARAAMAMMPDMSQAQNVIRALQGVVSSSGGAVEQMQKAMGDLARMGNLTRK